MGRVVKSIVIPDCYFELLKEYMARNRQLIENFKSGKTTNNKRILLVVRCADALISAAIDPRSNPWDETIGTSYQQTFESDGFESEADEISYKLNLLDGLIVSSGRCRVTDIDPLLSDNYFGNHTRICCDSVIIPDDIRKILSNVSDELFSTYINGNASQKEINKAASLMELFAYIDNRFSYTCLKPISVAERFSGAIRDRDFDTMFSIIWSIRTFGLAKVIFSQTGNRVYGENLHETILDIKPDWSGIEMLNN